MINQTIPDRDAIPPDLPADIFDLDFVVAELRDARTRWRTQQHRPLELAMRELPDRAKVSEAVDALSAALFPLRLGPPQLKHEGEDFFVGHTLDVALQTLLAQVRLELRYAARLEGQAGTNIDARAASIVHRFALTLPAIREQLDTDVHAAYRGDPAARSVDEVLLCYPSIVAVIHHRLAHRLHLLGAPLLARLIAELAHSRTGIDIHPGACIGSGFFIDHGTGVVIGETAVIGDRVRLYQAVTLGAKRFPADETGELCKGLPRHPVIEDDVVIYAGATVLGRVTIGHGSTIGGSVWLTHSVPADSHVTQATTQQLAVAVE
jgi:serine O-acetyltransferase